jgi:hypothetical protein
LVAIGGIAEKLALIGSVANDPTAAFATQKEVSLLQMAAS